MKNLANRLFLFAATAVFLGTAAYGQTGLKTTIPFGFRLPGGGAAAGNYVIRLHSTGNTWVVHFYNTDTHKSLLTASSSSLSTGVPSAIRPRLVFRCSDESGCALSEIWTPAGGYSVAVAKARGYEYVASIALNVNRGNQANR